MPTKTTNRGPIPTPIVSQPPHIPLVRDPRDFPKIAYPTVILALVTLTSLGYLHHIATSSPSSTLVQQTSSSSTRSFGLVDSFYTLPSFWIHFFLRVLLTYTAFTVMHDCSHDSVARPSSGASFLNPLLGWTSAICFGAPFPVFKHIHLDHHRYTNAVEYDADLWAGGNFKGTAYSPKKTPFLRFFLLPLRCSTQLYHYLLHAAKYLVANFPPLQFFRDVSIIVAFTVFPLVSFAIPSVNYFFWLYHAPVLVAVMILGMCFDYLPHRPHAVTDNPILATSLITWSKPASVKNANNQDSDVIVPTSEIKKSGIDWLTVPLLSQNFHPIHHLYPNIPFYRYSSVYYRMADTLQAAGLQAHPLFPLIVSCDDE